MLASDSMTMVELLNGNVNPGQFDIGGESSLVNDGGD